MRFILLAQGILCLILWLVTWSRLNRMRTYQINMVEASFSSVVITKSDQIVYANENAKRLFNVIGDQVAGSNIIDWIQASERGTIQNILQNDYQLNKRIQTVISTQDGRSVDVELVTMPVLYDGKVATQWLIHDITREIDAQNKIRRMAYYDNLTGLLNRTSFQEILNSYLANQQPFFLMMLDLDGFKSVNDTLGHDAGDEVLREFSRRLQSFVREHDHVFRLAGDEFTIMVPIGHGTDNQVALQIANRILEGMREPFLLNGQYRVLSASIGITSEYQCASDKDTVLKRADDAMYKAKRAGKNQYQFQTETREVWSNG